MAEESRTGAAMKVGGVAGVVLFLALVARFWDPVYGWTCFLQLDAPAHAAAITEFKDLPIYVYRNTGGYDGAYYAQLAYHPLLDDAELRVSTDSLAYRARRILPPALAWLLAGGRTERIVTVYCALNVAAWLVLAALLWRTIPVIDARGLFAWTAVMFSAGALASVRLALTDLLATTLIVAAVWSWERRRDGAATGLLAAAGLSRETALLALAGLLRRPWLSRANLVRACTAALPLALWIGYVRFRIGPGEAGWHNFNWPLAGLLGKIAEMSRARAAPVDPWLVASTLLAVVGLIVQAVWMVVRRAPDDPWWRTGAAYTGLMVFLGTPVWEGFPGAAPRVLLPLTVAFNVLAVRRRIGVTWMVIANVSVVTGLLALLEVPHDPHQLATARVGRESILVQTDAGWFDREHSARHVWAWTRRGGTLNLRAWPASTAEVNVELGLRSLDTRTVTIREHGHAVWRGRVDNRLTSVALPVRLDLGRAVLECSTDAAPVAEGTAAGGRELGFAVYDLRLSAAKP